MAKISQLYNKNKEKIYPITSADSVINPDTGYPISSEIKSIKNSNMYGQVTLTSAGWDSDLTETVIFDQSNFLYNPLSSIVYIYPTKECTEDYKNSCIECFDITNKTMSFTAKIVPQNDITLDIFVITKDYGNV